MSVPRIAGCIIAALLCWVSPCAASDTPCSLVELGWMQGHWIMEGASGRAEEIWMAPVDGPMVGSFRWVMPGGQQLLEFLVIEQRGGDVFFRFKHFDRDYRAWEEQPNVYRLARVEGHSARFENVAWNGRVPKTLHYQGLAPNRLTFCAESPDSPDGVIVPEFSRAD